MLIQDEYLLGINTNAPKSADILNYEYEGILEVEMDIWSWEIREAPISNFNFSIRISKFPNNVHEIRYNYSSFLLMDWFPISVTQVEIRGSGSHQLKINHNSSAESVLEQFEDSSNKLEIRLHVGPPKGALKPRQVNTTLEITFNSYSAIEYQGGSLNFNTWLDTIPFFLVENLALASAAGIGMIYSASQLYSGMKGTSVDLKEKIDKENLTTKIKDSAEIIKTTKEGVEIAKDGISVKGLLSKDATSEFISKYILPLFYLYIFFLSSVLLLTPLEGFSLIIQMIFLIYGTFLTVFISVVTIFGIFRPKIILRIGRFVPPSHILLLISGFGLLAVIINLNIVAFTSIGESVLNFLFVIFFFLSLIGFGISSAFSGYYIARVGISWKELVEKFWKKIRLPQTVIYLFRIIIVLLFFVLVLTRLAKTFATIITLYSQNQIANNAYLITLAAAYMKNDLTGSIWIVYGILALFVIQGVMQLYLHIVKIQVDQKVDLPQIRNYYKALAMGIIIFTLNFVFIFYSLNVEILESNLEQFIFPSPTGSISVFDMWNIYVNIAPFKLLIEVFLSIGVLLGLPFAITEMLFSGESEK